MIGAGWHIRSGNPGDRELLASFACADPAVRWQGEVERFIQEQLADWAFDPHASDGDPRLLIAFTTAGDIFGVAAHERVTLQAGDGTQFPATKLEVGYSVAVDGLRKTAEEQLEALRDKDGQ
jgi:hypothetical protein